MHAKKNELGLWEVFAGGEMVARVRTPEEADRELERQGQKIAAEIEQLKAKIGQASV